MTTTIARPGTALIYRTADRVEDRVVATTIERFSTDPHADIATTTVTDMAGRLLRATVHLSSDILDVTVEHISTCSTVQAERESFFAGSAFIATMFGGAR